MTKTFSNSSGGSWETDANWTPSGVPGGSDDVLINKAGTYTVTIGAIENPNSVTLSDAGATLSIAANGQLLLSPVTLNAGTLLLTGMLEGSTVVDSGGTFSAAGGTLNGVTWQGPLTGTGASYQTLNIANGITLLNLAGTGPGTLDINSMYMVNILDSTLLSNMTINFDAYNIEYLTGSFSAPLNIDTTTTLNQSAAGAEGEIEGATLISNGTISATGNGSSLFIGSGVFDNVGTLVVGNGDHVTTQAGFNNTGTVSISGTGKLTISAATSLSNTGTISVTSASSLVVGGSLSGTGVITVANFSVLDLYNTTNVATFLDSKGTLRVETPGTFTGKIAGLQKGDKIDLLATPVTKLSYAGSTASGVLTVLNNGTAVAALSLLGDYRDSTFAFTSDGATGNDISVAVTSIAARTLSWTGDNGTTAFSAPANWIDVSDTLNPALTAPISIDTVVFNTSGAAISGSSTVAVVDVGKSGAGVLQLSAGTTLVANSLDAAFGAADVGQIGLTGTGTELSIKGAAVVADDGTGVMDVLAGATFAASSLTIGSQGDSSGALVVSGNGSTVNLSGSLNIGTANGTGDLTVGPGAAIQAQAVFEQGQVVLEGGLLDPTVQLINQGQTAGGFGTIAAGDIVDEGAIQAGGNKGSQKLLIVQGTVLGGGTLTVDGTQAGSVPAGIMQINAGGTLELSGAVLNAATTTFTDNLTPTGTYTVNNSVIDVNFVDATGVLLLNDIAGFGGTVTTYQAGNSFVIAGGTLSGLGVSGGTTLTVSDSGANAGAGNMDRIIFGAAVNSAGFKIVNNNTIQAQVACFAEGTMIETARGPVAVERLVVGDIAVTAAAPPDPDVGHAPIVWIGQRTVECNAHPRPETVWPVRVSAGALGENVPNRDLYLSPDHAVLINGVLVPVRFLVDGVAIVQVPRDQVRYFHVELPWHDIILAEGFPVESYLDTGDRADFANGGTMIRLHPDFAVPSALAWETRGAARRVMTGAALRAARAFVAAKLPANCSRRQSHRRP